LATTTNLALRYPADANTPDGPGGIGNLAQDIDAFYGPWTTWTPVVTQNGTLTFTVNYAKYRRRAKTCEFNFKLTYASGTATSSNKITVTAPTGIASVTAGLLKVGTGEIVDASVTNYFGALCFDTSSTSVLVYLLAGGLGGAATMTAALTTSDVLYGSGKYETA
jgi:hypothetical protein